MGVVGNEYADRIAGEERKSQDTDPFEGNCISEGDFRTIIKAKLNEKTQQLWNTKTQNKYQNIHPSIEYENVWDVKRKDQLVINRIRAGHTFLTHSYLMSKSSPPECESCSEVLSVHIFECNSIYSKSYNCIAKSTNWKMDLFNPEKYKNIKKFLKINDIFNLI